MSKPEPETSADSLGASPLATERTPRLAIRHLMLWMLCSGVHLTVMQALAGDFAPYMRTSIVINGVITGAVVAGAVVLVYRRVRRGSPMLRHPGYWLLLVLAGLKMFHLLWLLFQKGPPLRVDALVYTLPLLVSATVYAIAAARSAELRWRALFVALATWGGLHSLCFVAIFFTGILNNDWFTFLISVPVWGHEVLSGWLVVVAIIDLLIGPRRDWLHWTGVAVYVAGHVATFWTIGPAIHL